MICSHAVDNIGKRIDFFKYPAGGLAGLKEIGDKCARMRVLNAAHHQSKYGEMPLDETLAMIGMNKPNEQQLRLLADGMETMVGALGSVIQEFKNKESKDRVNHQFLMLNLSRCILQ